MRRRIVKISLNAGLILIGLTALIPVLWMVSASFMSPGEAGTFPPPMFPKHPTFEHYRALTGRLNMGRYFLNSFIIASAVTLISTLLNSMAGFAFAKYHFKGRDRLFSALLSGMIIPAQVTMLPLLGSVMPACGGGALRAGIFIANVVRWKKSHNPKRRSGNGSAWWDRLPAGKWQFAGGKTLCVAEGLT